MVTNRNIFHLNICWSIKRRKNKKKYKYLDKIIGKNVWLAKSKIVVNGIVLFLT